MTPPHLLDEAIALAPQEEGVWQGRTHADWANMIGPYGGITAAQALTGILLHPRRLGDPVALTVNFAAALADGEFTVHARPARTNRSTQHWIVEVRQQEQAVVTATAVTALRRPTWGEQEARMPTVPRPGDVPRSRGKRVEWLKRYDTRFIEGHIPGEWEGQDAGHSRTRLWVRDDPERALDFASLTAISDVFFPRLWLRRAKFTPVGTVSMTIYYHADAAQLAATGSGYLLAQAQGQGFRNGYLDQAAQLWNEAGELIVTTHQIMYYKE